MRGTGGCGCGCGCGGVEGCSSNTGFTSDLRVSSLSDWGSAASDVFKMSVSFSCCSDDNCNIAADSTAPKYRNVSTHLMPVSLSKGIISVSNVSAMMKRNLAMHGGVNAGLQAKICSQK